MKYINKVTEVNENDLAKLFEKYIQKLNVPNDRKAATPLNARWFIRQGYVQNRNNPVADQVLELARKIA
jgi:hypothetical protein